MVLEAEEEESADEELRVVTQASVAWATDCPLDTSVFRAPRVCRPTWRLLCKVIDASRAVVVVRGVNDQWSVWEIRMHQSFDDEDDAYAFGEASDAAFEARGKPPRVWAVITFPDD